VSDLPARTVGTRAGTTPEVTVVDADPGKGSIDPEVLPAATRRSGAS